MHPFPFLLSTILWPWVMEMRLNLIRHYDEIKIHQWPYCLYDWLIIRSNGIRNWLSFLVSWGFIIGSMQNTNCMNEFGLLQCSVHVCMAVIFPLLYRVPNLIDVVWEYKKKKNFVTITGTKFPLQIWLANSVKRQIFHKILYTSMEKNCYKKDYLVYIAVIYKKKNA